LLQRDLPELLFRTLAAVGQETAARGKMPVAPIEHDPHRPNLAQTYGCEIVFPDIHTHYQADDTFAWSSDSTCALRTPAIPPLTQVRGFLAEVL